MLVKYLDLLQNAKLLNYSAPSDNRYTTTAKGLHFQEKYLELQEIIAPLKLWAYLKFDQNPELNLTNFTYSKFFE